MENEKKLKFVVTDENGSDREPRWVKAEAVGATCPECRGKMIVVLQPVMYAFCPTCKEYKMPKEKEG